MKTASKKEPYNTSPLANGPVLFLLLLIQTLPSIDAARMDMAMIGSTDTKLHMTDRAACCRISSCTFFGKLLIPCKLFALLAPAAPPPAPLMSARAVVKVL